MTCSSHTQSCVEGEQWPKQLHGVCSPAAPPLDSSSEAGLYESWREGANSSRISSLFFTDLYLSVSCLPSSSYIKPASCPFSLALLGFLPSLALVPSQGVRPWGMTGAWWEGSFLHQPSRGGSEMRLALGNLATLSVSWSAYELHFRDERMPAAHHFHFPI